AATSSASTCRRSTTSIRPRCAWPTGMAATTTGRPACATARGRSPPPDAAKALLPADAPGALRGAGGAALQLGGARLLGAGDGQHAAHVGAVEAAHLGRDQPVVAQGHQR